MKFTSFVASSRSQEGRQVWETEEGGEASQVSPAPTADTDEVAATVVSRDGPVCGSTGYDFKHIDHRMALYLMMSVFDNSEEFKFKVEVSPAMCFFPFFFLISFLN